jgi:hypothetical protein
MSQTPALPGTTAYWEPLEQQTKHAVDLADDWDRAAERYGPLSEEAVSREGQLIDAAAYLSECIRWVLKGRTAREREDFRATFGVLVTTLERLEEAGVSLYHAVREGFGRPASRAKPPGRASLDEFRHAAAEARAELSAAHGGADRPDSPKSGYLGLAVVDDACLVTRAAGGRTSKVAFRSKLDRALLEKFIRNGEHITSMESIRSTWQNVRDCDPEDPTIYDRVSVLRRKLKPLGVGLENVPGTGYRLIAGPRR